MKKLTNMREIRKEGIYIEFGNIPKFKKVGVAFRKRDNIYKVRYWFSDLQKAINEANFRDVLGTDAVVWQSWDNGLY